MSNLQRRATQASRPSGENFDNAKGLKKFSSLENLKKNLMNNSKQDQQPDLSHWYFRRYEILTEFANLRNPNQCPSGIYVMPSNDINKWFGVIFVRSGYYQHATLKFQLDLLPDYPYSAPLVTFITDTFHPLVNQNGQFSLKPKFNPWVPKQHHILDVLFYLKKSFKKSFLEELTEAECFNKEAWRMYHNELHLFSRLAQQCAKVSNADSVLYDDYPSGNPVKFKPLSDSKFEEIRTHILGPDANNNTNSLQLTTNSGSSSPSKFLDTIKNNISNNINKLFEP